ncbi:RNA polymerase sigma factor [Flectobacillus roseus]|uniref:Sigma-70 family RNA polymerase sigma factor n=1 Tax=Flectobacillus roseus TaxID=502259 RepID=A0ABT6Y766_9BACT|nr:sigma-70 family RNA polymerase sigma factor [Flectobacillus roseus]MDI9859371.1 sigma-70 family RNA polymerase sigma factor [Flectobacillus roseus]
MIPVSKRQLKEQDVDYFWNAFRLGDINALGSLYQLYSQDLLSYGYRISNDRQLIKDSIQDLFLSLWQQRANIADTTSVKFYLYRSLRNKIIRNTEVANVTTDYESSSIDTIIADLPFESIIIEEENTQNMILKLRQAIASLPQRQQEVIQLRYYHDFSNEEIANLLEISNQSVRNLIYESMSRLRRLFAGGILPFYILLEALKKI